MHRQRVHYWSCSRIADWLRGTPKPGAATGEGWNAWRKSAKNKSRFRYWLAEEGLNAVQDVVNYPMDVFYTVRSYVTNRWVFRTNSLTAHRRDIKPGQWRDVGNRFLPCLFNELVDFVEIEAAANQLAWSREAREKYGKVPGLNFYLNRWRCPEAGLDHFKWAAELTNSDYVDENDPEYGKPTAQALAAREIMELYDWWLNVRPNRVDPHELSGWGERCENRRKRAREEDGDDEFIFMSSDRTADEEAATRNALDKLNEIEKQYEEEDTQMLIRLIKVRNSLWT